MSKERADVRRHRAAVLQAAAAHLAAGGRLDLQAVAAAAGISRSTLYRHFGSRAGLEQALVEAALGQARRVIVDRQREMRSPLGSLRAVVTDLVTVGARFGLRGLPEQTVAEAGQTLAAPLLPLARQLLEAAELPTPPKRWLGLALGDLAARCLRATEPGTSPAAAGEGLFAALTEPLDRGLVLLDATGKLLAANALGTAALGLDPRPPRPVLAPRAEILNEDGSAAAAEQYPLALVLASGQSQPAAVRGHRTGDEVRWFVTEVVALRATGESRPYGVLAILTDITEERVGQLAQLRQPGTLKPTDPLLLDVARVLDAVPAHLLAKQLLAEAQRLVKVAVALYVVDIDGTHLLRLAGSDPFPERVEAPLALGPELAEDGIPQLRERLQKEFADLVLAPLWLRQRAVGMLLAIGADERLLGELARQGAAAIELANGYTDLFDAARRRKEINPAAEIQQSLLPPRIVRLGGGEIASGMLPSYEVGGDWFDYVENDDGAWIAIADASGRGPRAAALGSIALAALRAARRNEAELEEAVQTMHSTVCRAGEEDFYLTAIVARWHASHRSFSWINCGHPPPLLLQTDNSPTQLNPPPDLPLGLFDEERHFRANHRRLAPGERLVLYSDGISQRPTPDGPFGLDGIVDAARAADSGSASATARAIQSAVFESTTDLLRDDAALVVFRPDRV